MIFVNKCHSDDPGEWRILIQQFGSLMHLVRGRVGSGARVHLFMSVTLPLAFGMGAVWGTVSEATFYHWGGKNYFPAVQIDRELRFS